MDEVTTATSTEAPAIPQSSDAERKLAENNAKLLSELKAERARNAKLLELAGADPKADPEKIAQAREAESRSRAERASKVEKAVIKGLFGLGKKLDEDQVEFILTGAQTARAITVDETGVNGVSDYLAKVAGLFGTAEPSKEAPKDAPRLPRQGAEDNPNNMDAVMATLRQTVNSWQQLVKMGTEKKTEFEKRFPTRYAELQSVFQGKYNPGRR